MSARARTRCGRGGSLSSHHRSRRVMLKEREREEREVAESAAMRASDPLPFHQVPSAVRPRAVGEGRRRGDAASAGSGADAAVLQSLPAPQLQSTAV